MSKPHRFTWQCEDGYAGGSRPQTLEISPDEIEDDMSDVEILSLLEDSVQDDFSNKVSPSWKQDDEIKFMKWALAIRDEKASKE